MAKLTRVREKSNGKSRTVWTHPGEPPTFDTQIRDLVAVEVDRRVKEAATVLVREVLRAALNVLDDDLRMLTSAPERVRSLTPNLQHLAKPIEDPKGKRRDPMAVERVKRVILSELMRVGPQRAEQMAATFKVKSATLALPLQQLIAKRLVKTSGIKRAMVYRLAK